MCPPSHPLLPTFSATRNHFPPHLQALQVSVILSFIRLQALLIPLPLLPPPLPPSVLPPFPSPRLHHRHLAQVTLVSLSSATLRNRRSTSLPSLFLQWVALFLSPQFVSHLEPSDQVLQSDRIPILPFWIRDFLFDFHPCWVESVHDLFWVVIQKHFALRFEGPILAKIQLFRDGFKQQLSGEGSLLQRVFVFRDAGAVFDCLLQIGEREVGKTDSGAAGGAHVCSAGQQRRRQKRIGEKTVSDWWGR